MQEKAQLALEGMLQIPPPPSPAAAVEPIDFRTLPFFQENIRKHQEIKDKIAKMLFERMKEVKVKEQKLVARYRRMYEQWRRKLHEDKKHKEEKKQKMADDKKKQVRSHSSYFCFRTQRMHRDRERESTYIQREYTQRDRDREGQLLMAAVGERTKFANDLQHPRTPRRLLQVLLPTSSFPSSPASITIVLLGSFFFLVKFL